MSHHRNGPEADKLVVVPNFHMQAPEFTQGAMPGAEWENENRAHNQPAMNCGARTRDEMPQEEFTTEPPSINARKHKKTQGKGLLIGPEMVVRFVLSSPLAPGRLSGPRLWDQTSIFITKSGKI